MKLALISDIHGNAVALENVLEHLHSKKPDELLVLGDIAFRGPEPKRAVQLVQQAKAKVIKGNADLWAVRGIKQGEVPSDAHSMMVQEQQWCQEQLGPSELTYLEALPDQLHVPLTEEHSLLAYHAVPGNCFEVVLPDTKEHEIASKMMVDPHALFTVYGHIHIPFIRWIEGRCMMNTGSVGLPFDGMAKSSYIWLETDGEHVTCSIERIAYDTEKVCRQYADFAYPNAQMMQHVIRHAVSPFAFKKI